MARIVCSPAATGTLAALSCSAIARNTLRGPGRAPPRGFADSEFNIGVMYFNDKSVKRDDFEIVKWISLAAAQKFAPAEFRLRQMYEKGVIFGKNEREALHWYRLAEARGDKNGPVARARVTKALNITGPLAAGPVPAAVITGFKPVR